MITKIINVIAEIAKNYLFKIIFQKDININQLNGTRWTNKYAEMLIGRKINYTKNGRDLVSQQFKW